MRSSCLHVGCLTGQCPRPHPRSGGWLPAGPGQCACAWPHTRVIVVGSGFVEVAAAALCLPFGSLTPLIPCSMPHSLFRGQPRGPPACLCSAAASPRCGCTRKGMRDPGMVLGRGNIATAVKHRSLTLTHTPAAHMVSQLKWQGTHLPCATAAACPCWMPCSTACT